MPCANKTARISTGGYYPPCALYEPMEPHEEKIVVVEDADEDSEEELVLVEDVLEDEDEEPQEQEVDTPALAPAPEPLQEEAEPTPHTPIVVAGDPP